MSQQERKPNRDTINRAIIDFEGFKSPSRKLLLLTLVRFGDWDGNNIFPGRQKLAAKTELSVRWVEILLKELETDGFIRAIENKKGGRGHKTHYEICVARLGLVAAPSPEIVNQVADRPPNIPLSIPPESPAAVTITQSFALDPEQELQRLRTRLESRRIMLSNAQFNHSPRVSYWQDAVSDDEQRIRELESELQHAQTN